MNPARKTGLVDLFLLMTVLALAGWYLAAKIDLTAVPAEDAAMLMRYAKHLGEGHGIVWNVGEAPVDGATDFLFMAILGGLYRLGVSLEDGVRGLGIAAHFLTLAAVYFGALKMSGGRRWAAWLSAAFLAVGPGLRYSEASFGTPFFALFAALNWLLALEVANRPSSTGRALLFALCSLIMGLIRPEGVLVGGLMMLAVLIRLGVRPALKILVTYLAVNLALGGVYFLWRWDYFGYPLPNPFYRKGGGLFYGASLDQALRNTLNMSAPFWLAYLYGLALCLRPLFRPLAGLVRGLGRAAAWLAREMSRRGGRTVITALQISETAAVIALIVGLTRASSPLHPVLIIGRYSPSYFAFLLALLATAALAWLVERWLARGKAGELTGMAERFDGWAAAAGRMDIWSGLRESLFLLAPALGYVAMWGLLSDEMNYLGRFQYALLPVMLISWPSFFQGTLKTWSDSLRFEIKPSGRIFVGLLIALLSIVILKNQYDQYLLSYQKDGRFDTAEKLLAFSGKGYTIAASEAGLLPLYSDWRAVDAWGLNDSWIAHNGGIDEAYLARYAPEVIMFHADYSPLAPPDETSNGGNTWHQMTLTLKKYAERHEYELAAVFGTAPRDTHYYYVKPNFADSAAIVTAIRGLEEEGYIFGSRSINFINYQRRENVR